MIVVLLIYDCSFILVNFAVLFGVPISLLPLIFESWDGFVTVLNLNSNIILEFLAYHSHTRIVEVKFGNIIVFMNKLCSSFLPYHFWAQLEKGVEEKQVLCKEFHHFISFWQAHDFQNPWNMILSDQCFIRNKLIAALEQRCLLPILSGLKPNHFFPFSYLHVSLSNLSVYLLELIFDL